MQHLGEQPTTMGAFDDTNLKPSSFLSVYAATSYMRHAPGSLSIAVPATAAAGLTLSTCAYPVPAEVIIQIKITELARCGIGRDGDTFILCLAIWQCAAP